MDIETQKKRLEELLLRREKYFLLDNFQKNIFREQFEKIQSEIIFLKCNLEIYHDELDLVSVWIDYQDPLSYEKYNILEQAKQNREIRWISKRYWTMDKKSQYIGLILIDDLSKIKNDWLRDICIMHKYKREGLMKCPWPTKLQE